MTAEQRLQGGFVNDVIRVGATVRKSPPRDPAFVRRLLGAFASAGWPCAPRFLGVDERGLSPGGSAVSGVLDRGEVLDVVLWWQERCWRGIEAAADDGQPAMVALRGAGVVEQVRAAHAWTLRHQAVLESQL